jgi:hypothetical protein
MKNYTTIENRVSKILSSADTYRYTCLTFTPRKEEGYTNSTYKQIGLYTNESEYTVREFIKRLKCTDIVLIKTKNTTDKRRNHYYIEQPVVDFRMVKKELLELDISVQLKGFMIQLFTIAVNNTLVVNLSINKIVKLIKISKPTAIKYLRELLKMEHITKTENGYKLCSKYFTTGKEKQLEIIKNSITGCTYLEAEFNKADWDSIVNPAEFWRSIEGGYRGKKKIDIKVEELIAL